jgi:glycerophosphoryl diester phosphodiesterase
MNFFIETFFSVKPFTVIGHRGAKGECAENTLPCLEHAIKAGADIVEVDVRETKDGHLIILHDETFERVAGVNKSPKELNLKEIKEQIKVFGEYEVPTLEEVLSLVKNRAGLFVEIKEPPTVEKVVKLLEEFNAVDTTAVISFYENALKRVKEINPELATGFIYIKPQNAIITAKKAKADFILPYYPLATPKAVAFAHRLKLKVVPWVVNDDKTLERVLKAKPDGIATDYPSWLVKKREKLKTP